MEQETFWMAASIVIALAAAGAAMWRAWSVGEQVSLRPAAERLTDLERAAGAARELVLAAEQLYETGRLPKDDRFEWALTRLAELHPAIDRDTLTWAIEAAVKGVKLLRGVRE